MTVLLSPAMNGGLGPGQWRECAGTQTVVRVAVWCPRCGSSACIDEHEIADDGKVTPSLVCQINGCGFHDYVILDQWESRT